MPEAARSSDSSWRSAIAHLKQTDPALARVIEQVGPCTLQPRSEGTHFGALLRSIVYQQLSGKAAATIHSRFLALYGGREPTAAELLATPEETLRSVGLSRQKLSYMHDLAAHVQRGDLPVDALHELDDSALTESLVRVKGIGRWTAQMFMMFRLGRPNVLPDLDLGIQKGIQRAYGLRDMPKPKDVLRIGEAWKPYASVASWYMWRVLELPAKESPTPPTKAKRATPKKAATKRATSRRPARKRTLTKKRASRNRAPDARKGKK